jgi:hypothetical protein
VTGPSNDTAALLARRDCRIRWLGIALVAGAVIFEAVAAEPA